MDLNFAPAVAALEVFLKRHKNKSVVAFHNHDAIVMREFFAQEHFWQMLHKIGFTDSFIEMRPASRKTYDTLVRGYGLLGKNGLLALCTGTQMEKVQTVYKAAAQYATERSGLKTTFVDHGISTYSLEWNTAQKTYFDQLGQFADALTRIGVIKPDDTAQRQVAVVCHYLRQIMATPKGAGLKATSDNLRGLLPQHWARLDDSATGKFIEEAARQAKGRIWMGYGNGHFTPCGVQSYLDAPLILNIHVDGHSHASATTRADHPDIFIGAWQKPAWITSYVLLLKEGTIIESPGKTVPESKINEERARWLQMTREASQSILAAHPEASWKSTAAPHTPKSIPSAQDKKTKKLHS